MKRLTVAVVDDSSRIQQRLLKLFAESEDADVIALASSVFDAIHLIRDRRPDIVVLDFRIQEGTAIDVLDGISDLSPKPEVFILTNYPDPVYRERCLRAGAALFLDKALEFDRLLPEVHRLSVAAE